MSAQKKQLESLLTLQEKKVLKQIVEGQSNKEIARTLRISPSTVRKHVHSILRKLELKNRVQAAVHAVKMGDCPLEQEEGEELKTGAGRIN